MKKTLILLAIPVIILALASCSVSPTANVGTPTNLAWTVGTNGLDLTLSWDAVADVDGYRVITATNDTIDVDTAYSYTFVNAGVGTYSVYAYKGSDNGTAATISNAPYEDTDNMIVYPLSSNSGGSGFDIDVSTGNANIVSMATNQFASTVDFYLDSSFYFVSANNYLSFTCDNKTRFLDNGTNDVNVCDKYVPTQNYYNMEKAVSGHNYMVAFCETDTSTTSSGPFYYGVIDNVTVTSDNIVFTYKYQTLKGFRKF